MKKMTSLCFIPLLLSLTFIIFLPTTGQGITANAPTRKS
ncbi:aminopeptidase [Escherichia coli]|nr:aminopeptidase [Escherichia coli]